MNLGISTVSSHEPHGCVENKTDNSDSNSQASLRCSISGRRRRAIRRPCPGRVVITRLSSVRLCRRLHRPLLEGIRPKATQVCLGRPGRSILYNGCEQDGPDLGRGIRPQRLIPRSRRLCAVLVEDLRRLGLGSYVLLAATCSLMAVLVEMILTKSRAAHIAKLLHTALRD